MHELQQLIHTCQCSCMQCQTPSVEFPIHDISWCGFRDTCRPNDPISHSTSCLVQPSILVCITLHQEQVPPSCQTSMLRDAAAEKAGIRVSATQAATNQSDLCYLELFPRLSSSCEILLAPMLHCAGSVASKVLLCCSKSCQDDLTGSGKSSEAPALIRPLQVPLNSSSLVCVSCPFSGLSVVKHKAQAPSLLLPPAASLGLAASVARCTLAACDRARSCPAANMVRRAMVARAPCVVLAGATSSVCNVMGVMNADMSLFFLSTAQVGDRASANMLWRFAHVTRFRSSLVSLESQLPSSPAAVSCVTCCILSLFWIDCSEGTAGPCAQITW